MPEGKVSLAFRLVFQRTDRTLTDARGEDRVVERVVTARFCASASAASCRVSSESKARSKP